MNAFCYKMMGFRAYWF